MLTIETILTNLNTLHKKNELTNEQKKKLSELYISIKYNKEVKETQEEEELKHFSSRLVYLQIFPLRNF